MTFSFVPLYSAMSSSARATSVRREVTLTSDPEDLLNTYLAKSAEAQANRSVATPDREEEHDLLALHRNGRVEFHVTRLHNCVNTPLTASRPNN